MLWSAVSPLSPTISRMSKPTGLDMIITSHVSSYGLKTGGVVLPAGDLKLVSNPAAFENLAKDFAEYGTAADNEILNRKRPIIEQMHSGFASKKPRLDAFLDQTIADIKEVCGEKHRYAEFVLASKRVRSAKRNANAAAKAAYEVEMIQKVDAIFAGEDDMGVKKDKILDIILEINAKATSYRAEGDDE